LLGWAVPNLRVPNIKFDYNIPDMETFDIQPNSLIILDYLISETNRDIANTIITKYPYHNSLTVIFIVDKLFPKNKHARDISTNAHYIIVFKQPRDKLQMQYLQGQIVMVYEYHVYMLIVHINIKFKCYNVESYL